MNNSHFIWTLKNKSWFWLYFLPIVALAALSNSSGRVIQPTMFVGIGTRLLHLYIRALNTLEVAFGV